MRTLALQLPEGFFTDLNIFPCDQATLLRFSQSDVEDACEKRWFSGQFNLLPEGDDLVLYRKLHGRDREVCRGDSGFLFEYVMRYCQQALPAFVLTHRRGFVRHPGRVGRFCEQLKTFRLVRSVSKGLDRCSKIDELDYVDQDSTYCKFPVEWHWNGNNTVWHIGSGMPDATSQRRLGCYESVILIDPIIPVENSTHWKKTWQDALKDIPPGVDVVSDVAIGDKFGMAPAGMSELVNALYPLSVDRMVMVKVNIELDYPGVRGMFVTKVRPHNAEAIFVLSPHGDPLDEDIKKLRRLAIKANEVRNFKIFRHQFDDRLKAPGVGSFELGCLMRARPPDLPPPVRKRFAGACRIGLFCQTIGHSRLGERFKAWRRVCRDREKPDCPYVILPSTYVLDVGPILNYDPGLNCPHISLRSIMESATLQRLQSVYLDGQWQLRNVV